MSTNILSAVESDKSNAALFSAVFFMLVFLLSLGQRVMDFGSVSIVFAVVFMASVATATLSSLDLTGWVKRRLARLPPKSNPWMGKDRKRLYSEPAFAQIMDPAATKAFLALGMAVLSIIVAWKGHELYATMIDRNNLEASWQHWGIAGFTVVAAVWLGVLAVKEGRSDRPKLWIAVWMIRMRRMPVGRDHYGKRTAEDPRQTWLDLWLRSVETKDWSYMCDEVLGSLYSPMVTKMRKYRRSLLRVEDALLEDKRQDFRSRGFPQLTVVPRWYASQDTLRQLRERTGYALIDAITDQPEIDGFSSFEVLFPSGSSIRRYVKDLPPKIEQIRAVDLALFQITRIFLFALHHRKKDRC